MKRKLLSLLLSLCMLLSLFPMSAFALAPLAEPEPTFSDTVGHWAANAIETWAERGVLKGENGLFRPNDLIKRAELAAVLNRVIGYTVVTNTAFADVPSDAWYYSDVAKLYAAGIMQGDGAGVLRPEANITREEAVVLLARAFDVPENAGNENPFPDAGSISGWASFLVDGMKAEGYISGDTAGNFNPKASITRAEVVTILSNMITLYFNTADERDCELIGEIDANALINTAGATIQNLTINGNLWITEGVFSGDVTLENVAVSGTTYIRGGGPNSIVVTGGSLGEIRLDAATNPALKLSKETEVSRIYLDNTGTVTHGGVTVSYDAATDTVTFGGAIDKVELNADGTATMTIGGIVYDVIPPEGAVSRFELAKDAVIGLLVTNGPLQVGGTGEIKKAEIHKDGVVIDKSVNVKPENITADEGVTITIGEKTYTGTGTGVKTDTPTIPSGGSGGKSGGDPAISVTEVSIDNTSPKTEDTLSAILTPADATATYSWLVNGVQKGTGATYTVDGSDLGSTITVTVTGTGTYKGTVTSAPTGQVSNKPVQFTFFTANGVSNTMTTTEFILVFDTVIPGFSVDDISLTGATKRALDSSAAPIYRLAISNVTVPDGAIIRVSPGKNGYEFTPNFKDVAVYKNANDVAVSLTANGVSDVTTTTELTITLEKVVPGLSADDLIVTGATKGALDSSNAPIYKLAISDITVANGANVNVAISKSNYTFLPGNKDVAVHIAATPVTDLDLTSLVRAPVTGQSPDTTAIDVAQYTGTISWVPAGDPFAASKVYTATVTLTAKPGYTFTGVVQNAFTYTNATSVTNAADSGTVSISFPQTGA